jgi:hypothetical protein
MAWIQKNRSMLVAWVLTLLLAGAAAVVAQDYSATLVRQAPSTNVVATNFATNATSNTTLTVTVPSGQYMYITAIEITNCAGAAVTGAAPLSITSTNLGGGITPAWTIGTTSTAGICNPAPTNAYYIPIKSNAPGTNVTFVLPTFTANQIIRFSVWYYLAP